MCFWSISDVREVWHWGKIAVLMVHSLNSQEFWCSTFLQKRMGAWIVSFIHFFHATTGLRIQLGDRNQPSPESCIRFLTGGGFSSSSKLWTQPSAWPAPRASPFVSRSEWISIITMHVKGGSQQRLWREAARGRSSMAFPDSSKTPSGCIRSLFRGSMCEKWVSALLDSGTITS